MPVYLGRKPGASCTLDQGAGSCSADFITPATEPVTAWCIGQTQPKPNHVSVYRHYLDCCEKLGIPGVR